MSQSILGEVREDMTIGQAIFGQNGLKNGAHKMFEVMSKPVPTEKAIPLSMEQQPQALMNFDPISAVAVYNSVEEVFEVKNLPDNEIGTTAKQVLSVQSDSKNDAYKVFDGMTISAPAGSNLLPLNYIIHEEYSFQTFNADEVSNLLSHSPSFKSGNYLFDEVRQPPSSLWSIESSKSGCHLFDEMTELTSLAQNKRVDGHEKVVLQTVGLLRVLSSNEVSSANKSSKSKFEEAPMFVDITCHELVVELWFVKMISFVFDPGGSYLCYNGCDPFKLTRDEHECLAKSAAWNVLSWSDAFIELAGNPDKLGPVPRLSQTYAKFFRDNVLPCKFISVLVYIVLGAAEYRRTLYDNSVIAFPYFYSYGLSLESLDWKLNLQRVRLFGVLTTMIKDILMDLSANGSLLGTLVKDGLVTLVDIILHPGKTEFDTNQSCGYNLCDQTCR